MPGRRLHAPTCRGARQGAEGEIWTPGRGLATGRGCHRHSSRVGRSLIRACTRRKGGFDARASFHRFALFSLGPEHLAAQAGNPQIPPPLTVTLRSTLPRPPRSATIDLRRKRMVDGPVVASGAWFAYVRCGAPPGAPYSRLWSPAPSTRRVAPQAQAQCPRHPSDALQAVWQAAGGCSEAPVVCRGQVCSLIAPTSHGDATARPAQPHCAWPGRHRPPLAGCWRSRGSTGAGRSMPHAPRRQPHAMRATRSPAAGKRTSPRALMSAA